MTFENFARCLRAFCRRRPFKTFLLQMTTGETIPIEHPEAIRLHDEIAVLMEPNSRRRFFDAESVCQFIEVPPPPGDGVASTKAPEE